MILKQVVIIPQPYFVRNHNFIFMLKQTKLLKSEWDSIEIPIDGVERSVMRMLMESYDKNETTIKISPFKTLIQFLKLTQTPDMDLYLYTHYYDKRPLPNKILIKKSDKIRIQQNSANGGIKQCWETIVLETVDNAKKRPHQNIYKLFKLLQSNVICGNSYVYRIAQKTFDEIESQIDYKSVIYGTTFDLDWEDLQLYAFGNQSHLQQLP